jgi:polyphosphate kinase 2 (PPK2 family)
MGKTKGRDKDARDRRGSVDGRGSKMRRKEYEHQLARLQGELVALQEWVKATRAKICIVLEGRDTAGREARSSASQSA